MISDRCNHNWETHAKDGHMKVKGTSLTACTAKGCPCDVYFPRKEMSSGGA